MSDSVNLMNKVMNLDVSPKFANYSRVILHKNDKVSFTAGNDSGRTLELNFPFATQYFADRLLLKLRGFQYQPYAADGSSLDPAAEIGDAVTIRGTYGGVYSRFRDFGPLMRANIAAPYDQEIDHEYKYTEPEVREFTRQFDSVQASLQLANDAIEAKVSRTGPSGQSSFSWTLSDDSHTWYSNGQEVMRVSATGLMVKGEVQATSGKIGGFTIGANSIYNNLSSFGGSQSYGVYIGTNGIQLGQNFKVDGSGNVTASNMTLSGTLKIGDDYISAYALRSGAQTAYNNGWYWSSGSAYGYSYNDATDSSSGTYPNFFRASTLQGNIVHVLDSLKVGNSYCQLITKSIGGTLCTYLGTA